MPGNKGASDKYIYKRRKLWSRTEQVTNMEKNTSQNSLLGPPQMTTQTASFTHVHTSWWGAVISGVQACNGHSHMYT